MRASVVAGGSAGSAFGRIPGGLGARLWL